MPIDADSILIKPDSTRIEVDSMLIEADRSPFDVARRIPKFPTLTVDNSLQYPFCYDAEGSQPMPHHTIDGIPAHCTHLQASFCASLRPVSPHLDTPHRIAARVELGQHNQCELQFGDLQFEDMREGPSVIMMQGAPKNDMMVVRNSCSTL